MSPIVAEFIGTTILILMGGGVVANVLLNGTKGHNGGWIVITTAWALAVFIGVVIAGPHSGAHLSPAVSVGLAVAGKFSWDNVLPYFLAQLSGSMLGAVLVWIVYKDHFDATRDGDLKRAVFCTDPAIRNPIRNLISETVGTFVLILCVVSFTDAKISETDQIVGLGSIGAIPVALVVWAIGLSLGGTTGYAINPVRDFGPRVVHALLPIKDKADNDWGYAWVPFIGPIIGAALAGFLFSLI